MDNRGHRRRLVGWRGKCYCYCMRIRTLGLVLVAVRLLVVGVLVALVRIGFASP